MILHNTLLIHIVEKLKSNLHEVKSRGSELIIFKHENSRVQSIDVMQVIQITSNLGIITTSIIFTIPLQLLSYDVAPRKRDQLIKEI